MHLLRAERIGDRPDIIAVVDQRQAVERTVARANPAIVVDDRANAGGSDGLGEIHQLRRRPSVAGRHDQRFRSLAIDEGFDGLTLRGDQPARIVARARLSH